MHASDWITDKLKMLQIESDAIFFWWQKLKGLPWKYLHSLSTLNVLLIILIYKNSQLIQHLPAHTSCGHD
jgi:hypothetical protein